MIPNPQPTATITGDAAVQSDCTFSWSFHTDITDIKSLVRIERGNVNVQLLCAAVAYTARQLYQIMTTGISAHQL